MGSDEEVDGIITKNVMSMMLMFAPLTIQIYESALLWTLFFRSQEWQEVGRHGQRNVQGLHDDEERDKHDADVCVADNLDLSVRLFTDAILCQGWKGDKKVEDMVTDKYTVFVMTKNVMSMMLMFVCATDYSDLWVIPEAPPSSRTPQSL